MEISYQEFKPSLALQPYIESYWCRAFNGLSDEVSPLQRCLPLGMSQIIIHTSKHLCHAHINDEWEQLPNAFLVGVYREAVSWTATGPGICFGINLKPESMMHLFKIPVSGLFNNYTDLQSFLGKKVSVLIDKMYGVECPLTLIRLAEEFLMQQLRNIRAERNYIDEATRLIRQSKGNITIEELSKNLYISERQLQRVFKDTLGTSPKTYTRIIRFRNAFQYVQQSNKDVLSWTDVSYNFGYADQAHFIRDFKEFTGISPASIGENRKQIYQFSNEPTLIYS